MLQKDEINLLPPQVLKARSWHSLRRRVDRVFIAAVIGGVIVLVTYGTIWWVLSRTHSEFTGEIATTAISSDEAQKQVRRQNSLLRTIVEQIEAYPRWTPLVGEALTAAPAAVDITGVRLFARSRSQAPDTLVIAGESVSRPAIVEYENRLKELEWVQEVEAPLANLASGERVNFSFTLIRAGGLQVLPEVPEAEGELEEETGT